MNIDSKNSSEKSIYSQQLDFRQGAAQNEPRSLQVVNEEANERCNTAENSSAKSILIIGSGGREHALAWHAAKSAYVKHVFVAPGNAGTAIEPKISNVEISATSIAELLSFAKQNAIDLTIVGPEAPLALGIVDRFNEANLRCFGPTRAAAQLESSKEFAKNFMTEYKIPTASYATFSDTALAKEYLQTQPLPIVIKADGLAAGKGVVIAETQQEAEITIEAMLAGNQFGEAGHRIVIESFLRGEEATFIVVSDGKHAIPLVSSQDHKARDDGDKGPNTGGMGAYSPAPVITPALEQTILKNVIQPVIHGMAEKGTPYVGFLYAGLMISPQGGINVLEFNCRLGDPEAEVLLMRLQTNIVDICLAALEKQLLNFTLAWDPRPALGVVLAAKGYPDQYQKGMHIGGLDTAYPDCKIFHAGTASEQSQIVTQGGRVLCVCAMGTNIMTAQQLAYTCVANIHWDGMFYRRDIGYRAISTN